jgi:MFS superfamily sulfate permease-like transporter
MVSDKDYYLIRFHKDVSFLQKAMLVACFDKIPEGSKVIIDGSNSVFVDDDIIELIDEFIKRSKAQNISVELKKSSLAISPIFKEATHG